MGARGYTYEEIKTILLADNNKPSIRFLAERFGRSKTAVKCVRDCYKHFQKTGTVYPATGKFKLEAFKRFNNELATELATGQIVIANGVSQQQTSVSPDAYTRLDNALKGLQQAIEEVIKLEVDKRVKEEKQKVSTLMEEAKRSNWVDNLRAKFGNRNA